MKFFSRFYVLLAWAYLIMVLLITPMKSYEIQTVTYYDKIVHAILFGVLTYFINRALIVWPRLQSGTIIIISIFLSISYSALGEYAQLYVEGRTVSELDFLAGALGVVIASIVSYEVFHRKRK